MVGQPSLPTTPGSSTHGWGEAGGPIVCVLGCLTPGFDSPEGCAVRSLLVSLRRTPGGEGIRVLNTSEVKFY